MSPRVDEREVRACSTSTPHACHGYVLESVNYWCEGVARSIQRQNDDGQWAPATPLPRQGTRIDWEVSRKGGRLIAKGYGADDKLVRIVHSRWRLLLALKIKFGGRS